MQSSPRHSTHSQRPAHLATVAGLLLCGLLLLVPAERSALSQSTMQQPQSDGPPSGPPPAADDSSSTTSGTTGTNSGMQGGRRPGPPSPAMELDRLIKAMKAANVPLTDSQKVAILGVLEDKETAMNALRAQTDRSAAMTQMQALEQSARTAILAALTEAQGKVYSAMRSGSPQGRPGQQSPGLGGPPSSSGGAPPENGGSGSGGNSNIDANTGGGIPQGGTA